MIYFIIYSVSFQCDWKPWWQATSYAPFVSRWSKCEISSSSLCSKIDGSQLVWLFYWQIIMVLKSKCIFFTFLSKLYSTDISKSWVLKLNIFIAKFVLKIFNHVQFRGKLFMFIYIVKSLSKFPLSIEKKKNTFNNKVIKNIQS